MEISNKTVVSLRYIMKNSQGEILENTLESAPVQYLHGSGNILPQLEASLNGLKKSDTTSLSITDSNETFYFDVVIDDVRTASEAELIKGKPIDERKENKCGPDCCC